MSMNRRKFIGVGCGGLGALALGGLYWHAREAQAGQEFGAPHLITLGSSPHKPAEDRYQQRRMSGRQDGEILTFDIKTAKAKRLAVPLLAHGFTLARGKGIMAGIQKWGDLAVVVEKDLSRVIKTLVAPDGVSFSGHGEFIDSDRLLLLTGENNEAGGELMFYDVDKNFELARRFQCGRRLHELRVLDDDHVLLALVRTRKPDAYGAEGGVQILNWRRAEFGEWRPAPEGSHVLVLGHQRYVVHGINSTQADLAAGFVDWNAPKTVKISESPDYDPHVLFGEALSSVVFDEKRALLTAPDAGRLVVWNFVENRIASIATDGVRPDGVFLTADGSIFVNAHDCKLRRYRYSPETNKITALGVVFDNVGNGRHIYTFA